MKKTEIKKTLIEAKKLISNPDHWIKGVYTRYTSNGKCYCAVGAIREVKPREWIQVANYLRKFLPKKFIGDVVVYNDCRSHRSVMRLFDRAIKE